MLEKMQKLGTILNTKTAKTRNKINLTVHGCVAFWKETTSQKPD